MHIGALEKPDPVIIVIIANPTALRASVDVMLRNHKLKTRRDRFKFTCAG
jgi:hypothetical protein